jgi:hypothetical protein
MTNSSQLHVHQLHTAVVIDSVPQLVPFPLVGREEEEERNPPFGLLVTWNGPSPPPFPLHTIKNSYRNKGWSLKMVLEPGLGYLEVAVHQRLLLLLLQPPI